MLQIVALINIGVNILKTSMLYVIVHKTLAMVKLHLT